MTETICLKRALTYNDQTRRVLTVTILRTPAAPPRRTFGPRVVTVRRTHLEPLAVYWR